MNDTLVPVRSPSAREHALAGAVTDAEHLTLVDRLELRLGLWLLLRSARRRQAAQDHLDLARRTTNARSLSAREHAALRRLVLQSART